MEFSHQSELFRHILSTVSRHEFVRIIMQTLGVKQSTAYKYTEEKVNLSYNDIQKLLAHPAIAAACTTQHNLNNPNELTWSYPNLLDRQVTPEKYLQNIRFFVKQLISERITLHYTSYEIPIFYYMYFPTLFEFKLFYWSKMIWSVDGIKDIEFEPGIIINDRLSEVVQECLQDFANIPSREYWTDFIFDNTIRQLHYFIKMEYIKSIQTCKIIIQEIHKLKDLMNEMTSQGKKFQPDRQALAGDLVVFKNDIFFTNNIAAARTDDHFWSFCAYDNPNLLISRDKNICLRTLEWLGKMELRCTRLTQNNEKERHDYFNSLLKILEEIEL